MISTIKGDLDKGDPSVDLGSAVDKCAENFIIDLALSKPGLL